MPSQIFNLRLTSKVAERISHSDISLQDILFALFQDSVCAKASQVVISTSIIDDITWPSIVDDGEEVFASNESGLFLNKRASKDTYFIRSPRQLSICNLWHRGAVVESRRLSLTLAPENFPVNRDVQMRSSQIERGTKISFPMLAGEITELLRAVKCIATYSPIPLVFNGSKFKQNNRVLAQV